MSFLSGVLSANGVRVYILVILCASSLNGGTRSFSSALDLVQCAISNSVELKSMWLEVDAQKGLKIQSILGKNPEIGGEYAYKEIRTSSGSLSGQGASYGVSIEQQLEFPAKTIYRKAIAEKNLSLASNAVLYFQYQLAGSALSMARRLTELENVLEELGKIDRQHRQLIAATKVRPVSGKLPGLELLTLEASSVELGEKYRITAEETAFIRSELYRLLKLRPEDRLETKGIPQVPPFEKVKDLKISFSNTFSFNQKKVEWERSKTELKTTRVEALPDLTLSPFFNGEKVNDSETSFGGKISLPFPLWNWNQGKVKEAEAREKQAFLALDQIPYSIQWEIWRLFDSIKQVERQIQNVPEPLVGRLRDASELADREYRLGVIPLTLYLETVRGYVNVMVARGDATSHAWKLYTDLIALSRIPFEESL